MHDCFTCWTGTGEVSYSGYEEIATEIPTPQVSGLPVDRSVKFTVSSAPFRIELGGKFVHVEYFALRDEEGNYLGTLEVSQNLFDKRGLSGEQHLLSYSEEL